MTASALTSGPATPEFSSFEPVGTSELVNVSTGDFVYNIPLMDVEGYPINLAYHSGVGMDQEASMVGLGWTLNLGAINRNVRGLPDDFNGDEITHEFSMAPNVSYGVNLRPSVELAGIDLVKNISPQIGITYNNYKGLGSNLSAGVGGQLANLSYGLTFSYSSNNGLGFRPSIEFRTIAKNAADQAIRTTHTLGVASSFNSRVGLQGFSFSKNMKGLRRLSNNPILTFSTPTYSSPPSTPYLQSTLSMYFTLGVEAAFSDVHGGFGGTVSVQNYIQRTRNRAAFGYLYADQQDDHGSLSDFNREKDGPYIPGVSPNLPLSQHTFDTYMVTGQGLAGQFRPRRNDIGILRDPRVNNLSVNASASGQLALGAYFDVGVDVQHIVSTSESGRWLPLLGNKLANEIDFVDRNEVNDPLYEPAYFKQVGELTPIVDGDFISSIGGERAVRPELSRKIAPGGQFGLRAKTSDQLVDLLGNTYNPEMRKDQRDIRNTLFSALTAAEAAEYGFTQELEYYNQPLPTARDYYSSGQLNTDDFLSLSRASGGRQDHHVSEISVIRQDGARYVYGLPAYNWTLLESSFNVHTRTQDCENGLVYFKPGPQDG